MTQMYNKPVLTTAVPILLSGSNTHRCPSQNLTATLDSPLFLFSTSKSSVSPAHSTFKISLRHPSFSVSSATALVSVTISSQLGYFNSSACFVITPFPCHPLYYRCIFSKMKILESSHLPTCNLFIIFHFP